MNTIKTKIISYIGMLDYEPPLLKFNASDCADWINKTYPKWVEEQIKDGEVDIDYDEIISSEYIIDRIPLLVDSGYNIWHEDNIIIFSCDESPILKTDRKHIIENAYNNLTNLEKYKVDTFKSVAKKINSILGVSRHNDKHIFLEVDHAQTIFDMGAHHHSNLQLLTQYDNASKNMHSTDRMNFDEQIAYVTYTAMLHIRMKPQEVKDIIMFKIHQQLNLLKSSYSS